MCKDSKNTLFRLEILKIRGIPRIGLYFFHEISPIIRINKFGRGKLGAFLSKIKLFTIYVRNFNVALPDWL